MNVLHPRARQDVARAGAQIGGKQKKALKGHLRRRAAAAGTLYARAMMIEREGIARCREFAAHMSERGNDALAAFFGDLAQSASAHARRLAQEAEGLTLPQFGAGEYSWLDQGAPLPEAHAFVMQVLTPQLALNFALRAKERAKAYFDKVIDESRDSGMREVALELAQNEQAHIARLNAALSRVPVPYQPSEEHPGDPAIPQQL